MPVWRGRDNRPMDLNVADNPGALRYEITADGERVGFVTYRLAPGVISFLHAEVDPTREGHGIGSQLVRYALEDARARGLSVRPICPFVAWYVQSHPEYVDFIAGS
jgi:predicted GNAT family acetyltransferase